jgi:hypothetical protein
MWLGKYFVFLRRKGGLGLKRIREWNNVAIMKHVRNGHSRETCVFCKRKMEGRRDHMFFQYEFRKRIRREVLKRCLVNDLYTNW